MAKIKIKQIGSPIRRPESQKKVLIGLGLGKIFNSQLEVFAIGIHRSNHHFVAEHKLEIDLVCRDLDLAVATGDARQHQHPILSERPHALENYGRETGRFKDDVERSMFLRTIENREFVS